MDNENKPGAAQIGGLAIVALIVIILLAIMISEHSVDAKADSYYSAMK